MALQPSSSASRCAKLTCKRLLCGCVCAEEVKEGEDEEVPFIRPSTSARSRSAASSTLSSTHPALALLISLCPALRSAQWPSPGRGTDGCQRSSRHRSAPVPPPPPPPPPTPHPTLLTPSPLCPHRRHQQRLPHQDAGPTPPHAGHHQPTVPLTPSHTPPFHTPPPASTRSPHLLTLPCLLPALRLGCTGWRRQWRTSSATRVRR